MDKIIYILFSTLVLISFIGFVFLGIETKKDISGGSYRRWFLRPDNATVFYDPRRATLAAVLHFLTSIMLYGYLIPISLYVSIEIVKVLQSIFINQDQEMYYEESDRPAHTAIPDEDNESGEISYEAESPDETAFVIAARELGFEFFARTQSSISLHELHYESGKKVDRLDNSFYHVPFSNMFPTMLVAKFVISDEII